MTIRVKDNPICNRFSRAELEEIAAALTVAYEAKGVRPVYFGEVSPADTSLPWQMTDALGTPIGPIKFYKAGGWR